MSDETKSGSEQTAGITSVHCSPNITEKLLDNSDTEKSGEISDCESEQNTCQADDKTSETFTADTDNKISFEHTEEKSQISVCEEDKNTDDKFDSELSDFQTEGNVFLIARLMEQMGKSPLRVSKSESEMLINMLNEIELQPIDAPDPMEIPCGGGYSMEIENVEKYELLGGGYLKIGDNYFRDTNGKSEELSGKIGYVLYDYFGEP
ncbi:MAG: hypothetical protein PUB89_02905 [Oscillospiraceae bacterium]|nr:hypothetical protein [Oscillospiraceae bacterium]